MFPSSWVICGLGGEGCCAPELPIAAMSLQTAPACPAKARSSLRVSSPQPHVRREVRGAAGAEQDTWQPGPARTFQARQDKQRHSHSHGSWRPQRIPGPHPPRLQIAGDTPFQHPISGGRTQPRNHASHVPCRHSAPQDLPATLSPRGAQHSAPGTREPCRRHTLGWAGDGHGSASLLPACCSTLLVT